MKVSRVVHWCGGGKGCGCRHGPIREVDRLRRGQGRYPIHRVDPPGFKDQTRPVHHRRPAGEIGVDLGLRPHPQVRIRLPRVARVVEVGDEDPAVALRSIGRRLRAGVRDVAVGQDEHERILGDPRLHGELGVLQHVDPRRRRGRIVQLQQPGVDALSCLCLRILEIAGVDVRVRHHACRAPGNQHATITEDGERRVPAVVGHRRRQVRPRRLLLLELPAERTLRRSTRARHRGRALRCKKERVAQPAASRSAGDVAAREHHLLADLHVSGAEHVGQPRLRRPAPRNGALPLRPKVDRVPAHVLGRRPDRPHALLVLAVVHEDLAGVHVHGVDCGHVAVVRRDLLGRILGHLRHARIVGARGRLRWADALVALGAGIGPVLGRGVPLAVGLCPGVLATGRTPRLAERLARIGRAAVRRSCGREKDDTERGRISERAVDDGSGSETARA